MDAITTPSTPWLIQQLKEAHPNLTFTEAEEFLWSPSKNTVFYDPTHPNANALLLHEASHALLGHRSYHRDVELVAMEADAWEKARSYLEEHAATFAEKAEGTGILAAIDEDVIQDHLDTYREWLHARSTCPNCSATGYQTATATYTCPACTQTWRVNEARICALRRYRR